MEELLVDVASDGFTLYCCGPKAAPCALVACYEWQQYVDLLTIRDFDRVITARAPKRGLVDIFAPEVVERLSPKIFRGMWNSLIDADPSAEILTAWIAKEELRKLLALARPVTKSPPSSTNSTTGALPPTHR